MPLEKNAILTINGVPKQEPNYYIIIKLPHQKKNDNTQILAPSNLANL